MFEQCDPNTVTIVDTAIEEARRLGHDYLGTEHLLLALAQRPDLLPDAVSSLLPDAAAAVRSALSAIIDAPPHPHSELLKTVGVDLDEVRSAVRRTFGDEALERLGRRRVHQPWQPWRRPSRRCTSLLAGSMSVMPRVKQALEYAQRDADRRHRARIDPAGLLLGMVEVENALSNRLLRDTGSDPNHIRQLLSTADG